MERRKIVARLSIVRVRRYTGVHVRVTRDAATQNNRYHPCRRVTRYFPRRSFIINSGFALIRR